MTLPSLCRRFDGGRSQLCRWLERRLDSLNQGRPRPLAKSFQTGGECQAYLKNWIIERPLETERLPTAPAQLLELNTRSNSQCIASDDPASGITSPHASPAFVGKRAERASDRPGDSSGSSIGKSPVTNCHPCP